MRRPAGWVRDRAGLADDRPLLHKLGLASWSLIGIILLIGILIIGLSAVSSVLLPLVFALVFAVLFQPVVRWMGRHRVPPSVAAGLVVVAIVGACVGVMMLTVVGVIDQSERIGDEIEQALRELDIDEDDIADLRDRLGGAGSGLSSGAAQSVASGLSVVGEVVVGLVLGVLIFYYLLKDGSSLRRTLVARVPAARARQVDDFVSDTFFVLRRYWLGRTIVSAIVALVVGAVALALGLPLVLTIVVVTFIGGFIPYVGAVVGGALAVIVALGSAGIVPAVVMLLAVLVANLLIENLVEPAVTGRTLQIHPLVVLLLTTLGGTIGGIPGMIMAVPVGVIAQRAIPLLLDMFDPEDSDDRDPADAPGIPALPEVPAEV